METKDIWHNLKLEKYTRTHVFKRMEYNKAIIFVLRLVEFGKNWHLGGIFTEAEFRLILFIYLIHFAWTRPNGYQLDPLTPTWPNHTNWTYLHQLQWTWPKGTNSPHSHQHVHLALNRSTHTNSSHSHLLVPLYHQLVPLSPIRPTSTNSSHSHQLVPLVPTEPTCTNLTKLH